MYLVDTEQMLCQGSFQSDAPIMMVAFTPDVPGNFVSIDQSLSSLGTWNVSNPIPTGTINLVEKSCPVISVKRISGDFSKKHYMLAFGDGTTGVYDLAIQAFVFLSQPAHSDTVFDCQYKPSSPDILATVSNDGALKVWTTDNLECQTVLQGPDVLYALSWCPGDEDEHRLITCSVSGQCVIWDSKVGKILSRFRHHNGPSYRVRWNPSDANLICSTSVDMTAVVFNARDPNHPASPGQVVRKYIHPNMVYGCDWNLFNKNLLATGCHDGGVRVFDVSTTDGRPTHTFRGHRERVFNVEWSPLLPGVLASGSDDRTIRIWSTLAPGDPPKVLRGHSHNIRGLSWSWEVPFLILSGSWSGEIRVWDIRNEHCLQVLNEHHADVYGLVSHPKRPFTFASCSRDTSVRFWDGTESFVGRIQLESLLDGGALRAPALGEIKSAMNPHLQKVLLCGRRSLALARMVEDIKDNEMQRQQLFFEFFTAAPGTRQLFELMHSYMNNVPCDSSARMQHVNDLWKVQYTLAKQLQSSAVRIGDGTRERRQMHAARLFLLLGCMKQYCDILVDLGEWDRAISLAPSVSVTYWRSLCERYADILMAQRKQKAVSLLIASGRIAKLQEFQVSCGRAHHADALLASVTNSLEKFPDLSDLPFETKEELATKTKDVEKIVEEDEPEEEPEARDAVDVIPAILEMINIIAQEFVDDQLPVMAACCHLAVGEPVTAARALILGDEVLLAECLVRCLQLEGVDFVHLECAKRCEQLGMWDEALTAYNQMDAPGNQINLLCARCDRSQHEKAFFYAKAGLPTKAQWLIEAEAALKEGKKVEAATSFLCAGEESKCIEIAMELVNDILNKASWALAELESVIDLLNCVSAQLLPPTSRAEVLMMSYLLASQRAFTLGFGEVGSFLVQAFQTMATRANVNPPVPLSFLLMQELTHFAGVDPERASNLARDLLVNPILPPKLKANVQSIKKNH
jgi:WD40 repeat protein